MTDTASAEPDRTFDCPRCSTSVTERFWGPCQDCRRQLVASLGTGPAAGTDPAETSRFEPAMHVVPNHVATKD